MSQERDYFATDGRSVCRSVSQSVSPSWHWAPLRLMTRFWL